MVVSTNLHFIHLKDMPLESMEIEIIGSKGREKEREKAGNKGHTMLIRRLNRAIDRWTFLQGASLSKEHSSAKLLFSFGVLHIHVISVYDRSDYGAEYMFRVSFYLGRDDLAPNVDYLQEKESYDERVDEILNKLW